MKNRRIINIISFGAIGLVALTYIVKFVGLKIFAWPESVLNIFTYISLGILFATTVLSAFNFTLSRRNTIYNVLLVIFIILALVFFALMV